MISISRSRLFIPLLFSLFALRCAHPNDPESLHPSSGGYYVVSRLQTPGFAQSVVVSDTVAYLAQGEGGVMIVSIADPSRPSILAIVEDEVRGYSYRLALRDSIVYVAAGDFGVNVINAVDPRSPYTTAPSLNMKPARGFHIMGDYLFTAISEAGVKISEISYPPQPDIRGGLSTPGFARALTTTLDSAILLVACGEMGIALFDIRDLQGGFGSYRRLSWLDTPGYAEDVVLAGTQRYALLACGTAGLISIDFSDSTNPRIAAIAPTAGYARAVVYGGGKAYVAADRGGLQVFAVDQPTLPRLLGTVETTQAYGVTFDAHHIYVADRTEGLIIMTGPGGTP